MTRDTAVPTAREWAGRVLTSDDRVRDLCKWVGRGRGRGMKSTWCVVVMAWGGGRERVRVRVCECALFVRGS